MNAKAFCLRRFINSACIATLAIHMNSSRAQKSEFDSKGYHALINKMIKAFSREKKQTRSEMTQLGHQASNRLKISGVLTITYNHNLCMVVHLSTFPINIVYIIQISYLRRAFQKQCRFLPLTFHFQLYFNKSHIVRKLRTCSMLRKKQRLRIFLRSKVTALERRST